MKFNQNKIYTTNIPLTNNKFTTTSIKNKLLQNRSSSISYLRMPKFNFCKEPLTFEQTRSENKKCSILSYQDTLKDFHILSIRNNNKNRNKLNHLIFKYPLSTLPISKLCGAYCNHGSLSNVEYITIRDWFKQDICKPINVCTVTRENYNPIIKTGARYNTSINRKKINFILNHSYGSNKIEFNPKISTYGIKIIGQTMGAMHNACIATFYDDDWNQMVNENRHQKVSITKYTIPNQIQSCPAKFLQLETTRNKKCVYLFGYYLNHQLKCVPVSSFNYANFGIQFRLKSPNKSVGFSWEFRIIIDRNLFRQTRNYIKLSLFIIASQIYHSLSQYSFALHCWQGYYESFHEPLPEIPKCTFNYQYIDENNEQIKEIKNATATKHQFYILIDPKEIEQKRLKKLWIDEHKININDEMKYEQIDISEANGEKDVFIKFKISVFIWIIVLSNIVNENIRLLKLVAHNKIHAFFKMIHAKQSLSHYSSMSNRLKNMESAMYIWGTGEQQQQDEMKGIRLQYKSANYKTPLFYVCEHQNLSLLGEKTGFDMNACNLYHGPKNSNIGNHWEDYKFKGSVWTKTTGESSYLTIGAQHRALGSNHLLTIKTPNGCYIEIKINGLCMKIAPHGIRKPHLSWINFPYRLCDIYRFIQDTLIEKAQKHNKICEPNAENPIVCQCVQGSKSMTSYDKLPSIDEILPSICD